MLKIATILGTRPEIIKLSRVIPELDKHFKQVLIHTGQNYDPLLDTIFFEELGIRAPDERLMLWGTAARSPVHFVANVLICVEKTLKEHKPDAVLILGDTNSCIGAVYAAKRQHIPIFHMEAGNRCFDQRTPEEINRKVVDHLSDINMVYTEHARRNLEREGIPSGTIIKTGSPMREVLYHYAPQIHASTILEKLELKRREFFVASVHREETVDSPARFRMFIETLMELAAWYHFLKIIVSVHPRAAKWYGSEAHRLPANVILRPPLGFIDYVKLQSEARCVFSDSGTLTEEAALLGFPAVMLRQAHERPEGMDVGATIMSELTSGAICEAARVAHNQPACTLPDDYAPRDVARKVARTILSYTDVVNRTVWHK